MIIKGALRSFWEGILIGREKKSSLIETLAVLLTYLLPLQTMFWGPHSAYLLYIFTSLYYNLINIVNIKTIVHL